MLCFGWIPPSFLAGEVSGVLPSPRRSGKGHPAGAGTICHPVPWQGQKIFRLLMLTLTWSLSLTLTPPLNLTLTLILKLTLTPTLILTLKPTLILTLTLTPIPTLTLTPTPTLTLTLTLTPSHPPVLSAQGPGGATRPGWEMGGVLTFQKTVSKSVPWNFSGMPEVDNLGPSNVTNSSKSTCPSPAGHGGSRHPLPGHV